MSKEHELPSDSDDDDEDYVPEGADCEAVSEVESEGDAESAPEDENDENKVETNKGRKRSKGGKKKSSKRRKRVESDGTTAVRDAEEDESDVKKTVLSEEEEKKRADSLWADFMKDAGTGSKPKPARPVNGVSATSPVVRPAVEEKVKITKIFEFAGEEVKVEQEVPADSAEARLSLPSVEKAPKEIESPVQAERGPSSRGRGGRRAGLGGISSVLGQLGKKAKISTLEKSKLDWNNFKKEENIDEEINTHNRGKDGYLERQDFLQRADLRQFEIEKQLRLSRRSTR